MNIYTRNVTKIINLIDDIFDTLETSIAVDVRAYVKEERAEYGSALAKLKKSASDEIKTRDYNFDIGKAIRNGRINVMFKQPFYDKLFDLLVEFKDLRVSNKMTPAKERFFGTLLCMSWLVVSFSVWKILMFVYTSKYYDDTRGLDPLLDNNIVVNLSVLSEFIDLIADKGFDAFEPKTGDVLYIETVAKKDDENDWKL